MKDSDVRTAVLEMADNGSKPGDGASPQSTGGPKGPAPACNPAKDANQNQNHSNDPLQFEIFIDKGEAGDEDVQRVFDAISELNRALGGKGVTCREVEDTSPDPADEKSKPKPDKGGSS